jgi:hypothetical protein
LAKLLIKQAKVVEINNVRVPIYREKKMRNDNETASASAGDVLADENGNQPRAEVSS